MLFIIANGLWMLMSTQYVSGVELMPIRARWRPSQLRAYTHARTVARQLPAVCLMANYYNMEEQLNNSDRESPRRQQDDGEGDAFERTDDGRTTGNHYWCKLVLFARCHCRWRRSSSLDCVWPWTFLSPRNAVLPCTTDPSLNSASSHCSLFRFLFCLLATANTDAWIYFHFYVVHALVCCGHICVCPSFIQTHNGLLLFRTPFPDILLLADVFLFVLFSSKYELVMKMMILFSGF